MRKRKRKRADNCLETRSIIDSSASLLPFVHTKSLAYVCIFAFAFSLFSTYMQAIKAHCDELWPLRVQGHLQCRKAHGAQLVRWIPVYAMLSIKFICKYINGQTKSKRSKWLISIKRTALWPGQQLRQAMKRISRQLATNGCPLSCCRAQWQTYWTTTTTRCNGINGLLECVRLENTLGQQLGRNGVMNWSRGN